MCPLGVWKFEETVWIILTVLWSIFSLSFAFSHYTCIGMHLPMHINLTTHRWMDKKGRSRRVDARSNRQCICFYRASILVSRTNQISRAIKNWNKTFFCFYNIGQCLDRKYRKFMNLLCAVLIFPTNSSQLSQQQKSLTMFWHKLILPVYDSTTAICIYLGFRKNKQTTIGK